MFMTALFTVCAGLVALSLLLYLGQGRLIFIPSYDYDRTPQINGWAYEDVSVDVDGETTRAWYIPAEGEPKGTFLFSHGNAGNMAGRLESVGLYRELGYDVLVYDYGGYGESTGKPSEKRCYQDIRAIWKYLVETRNIEPNRIVLLGRSLGAGPTCQLATEVTPGAILIESTFTSVPDIGKEIYPFLPVRLLSRIKFDNIAKVPHFKAPALYVHSPDDTLIPYHHGQKLFEAGAEPKTALKIRGDHNEGFWISGALYTDALENFLDKHLGD